MTTSAVTRWRQRWADGDSLDRTFVVGIVLKGLNGVLEVVGGVPLLVATPELIRAVIDRITRAELAEDPHDVVATWLTHWSTSESLSQSGLRFAAAYLVAHGVVKLVLVRALLRDKLWAYPWMIGFLALFIGYQFWMIARQPTLWLIGLTVFDIGLTWLTVREWQRHREPGPAMASRRSPD